MSQVVAHLEGYVITVLTGSNIHESTINEHMIK